ncbi:hypothetical protein FOYG_11695 [Fusarium oxysporum NRRL 32931]|uniref:Uncharacterized protein n=1 Tax=Fusarium oxysporum NRRL 32931 TaxID=660029 RepID=W9HYU4_FUSOX|nr:hypothetical protein FOYG_11695 [Fusarium oxysporum NRRL 32931]
MGGITTVITLVQPPVTRLTTVTSTATRTGATTLPATSGETTTIVTFVPFGTRLTTVASTAIQTGRTTFPATPGGTTTVVTLFLSSLSWPRLQGLRRQLAVRRYPLQTEERPLLLPWLPLV